jgi:hypothetical protein
MGILAPESGELAMRVSFVPNEDEEVNEKIMELLRKLVGSGDENETPCPAAYAFMGLAIELLAERAQEVTVRLTSALNEESTPSDHALIITYLGTVTALLDMKERHEKHPLAGTVPELTFRDMHNMLSERQPEWQCERYKAGMANAETSSEEGDMSEAMLDDSGHNVTVTPGPWVVVPVGENFTVQHSETRETSGGTWSWRSPAQMRANTLNAGA